MCHHFLRRLIEGRETGVQNIFGIVACVPHVAERGGQPYIASRHHRGDEIERRRNQEDAALVRLFRELCAIVNRAALEKHLRHEPEKASRSRINCFRRRVRLRSKLSQLDRTRSHAKTPGGM